MNPYLKYTGLAFQLLFFIGAGYWLGNFAGPWLGFSKSTGQGFGILLFLVFGLVHVLKEVLKDLNGQ